MKRILSVRSLLDFFSRIPAGKNITYLSTLEIGSEAKQSIAQNLEQDDTVLCFIEQPIEEIRYIFKVISATNQEVELEKLLEVSSGLHIDSIKNLFPNIYTKLESTDPEERLIINLTDDEFSVIKTKLLEPYTSNKENISNLTQNNMLSINKNPVPDEISRNKIIYGAPGTGKSFEIDVNLREKYFNDDALYTRVTFNRNYTYSQFVGSYKPTPIYSSSVKEVEEEYYCVNKTEKLDPQMKPIIDYEVVPGPFLEILCKALANPEHNFLLILEEINRADAASVFGEIFQLLDRDDNYDSKYKVRLSREIMTYIYNTVQRESKCFKKDMFVKIPNNLYIWATMNSADQGVFKIDAAFQRRWSYGFISIDENENSIIGSGYKVTLETNSGIKYDINWYDLRNSINDILKDIPVTEDKLLGPFFLKKEELKNIDDFKFKLLLYLRDNVLRHSWNRLFIKNSFSDIMSDFDKGDPIFIKELKGIRVREHNYNSGGV